MPTAGERIAALEAEVAALRDAVAALRLEAVPGALAALAAGQANMAALLLRPQARNNTFLLVQVSKLSIGSLSNSLSFASLKTKN